MLARTTVHNAEVMGDATFRMRVSTWCVSLLAIAVIFFFIPVGIKAKAQLFAAPFVILIMSRLKLLGVRIHPFIIVLALFGAVLGVVWEFYHVKLAPGAFVVSTVSDQDLRQEAKIYRDRLRKSAGMSGGSVIGLHPSIIRDAASARRIVDQGANLGGVIWGSSRWMGVSLKRYEPLPLTKFRDGSVGQHILQSGRISDLLISRTVPDVGMSDGHAGSTVFFLAQIAQIWRLLPELTEFGAETDIFEGRMESLGRIKARWSSHTHTAMPLWLAGTLQLIRALESSETNSAYINCAIRNFNDALKVVLTRDNPALDMSIRNNLAIAFLARAELGIDVDQSKSMAMRHLAAAMLLRKSERYVGNVVAQNFYALSAGRVRRRR